MPQQLGVRNVMSSKDMLTTALQSGGHRDLPGGLERSPVSLLITQQLQYRVAYMIFLATLNMNILSGTASQGAIDYPGPQAESTSKMSCLKMTFLVMIYL